MITLKLVETDKSIQGKIKAQFANFLNLTLRRRTRKIVEEIKGRLPVWLNDSPTIRELSRGTGVGTLGAQFGLYKGTETQAIEAIIDTVVASMDVEMSPINKRTLAGGVSIGIVPATFQDLLNLPEGHVIDGDTDLHWLKWLLKEGPRIIVKEYSYRTKAGAGRSGGGFMEKRGFFRVPPEYAGTVEDNFITKALSGVDKEREIFTIIQRNLA